MQNLGLVLLVFAFVLSVIAGCFIVTTGRFHLGWLAVAFWIASELFAGVSKAFH
jgi:hypothetical protein